MLVLDSVALDDISMCLPRIDEETFFASWDLASMYHQECKLILILCFEVHKLFKGYIESNFETGMKLFILLVIFIG